MFFRLRHAIKRSIRYSLFILLASSMTLGQDPSTETGLVRRVTIPTSSAMNQPPKIISSSAQYADPVQGTSSTDLVRRALTSNTEIGAVRLDIERARARMRQAGLRQNPTIDFEQTTGRFTGSAGERETSIGFALPLEFNGVRQRRGDLARIELQAAEAEVADRERRLVAEVRGAYAEALAAFREMQMIEQLTNIDTQIVRVIEVRVTEGDAAPIEQNILRVEVDRLKARVALLEGRLQAILLRLRSVAGVPANEPLQLREELVAGVLPEPISTMEAAVDIALRTRPDLRLAQLTEEAAKAGLRLARAQGLPEMTAFSRYTKNRAVFDDTPVGILRDQDRLLTFGVSISIPLFNRNQGAKAEAETAIAQAQRRREFVEQLVRSEVQSAFRRFAASRAAIAIYEQGVMVRSQQNIQAIRGAYEIGAFRITDLLSEQRRYIDSQREYTEALAESYRALADLQSAIGNPNSK